MIRKSPNRTKPYKKLQPRGKNQLHIDKRRWNKEWHEEMKDVTWCESCGTPDGYGDAKLTMMHAVKQRFITTEEQGKRAAKVCWGEHRAFDFATGNDVHEKMAEFVDRLIEARTTHF